ncbi:hypothetical protein ES703_93470 [subsurface metagenome]
MKMRKFSFQRRTGVKRSISIILVVLMALTISNSQPALATIITVEVEGVVNSVGVGGRFALDGSVDVGSVMTGSATYDTETPDLDSGSYALISILMTIGNYSFTHDPSASEPAFFIVYTVDPGYRTFSRAPRFDGIIYVDGTPMTFDDITWEEPYGRLRLMNVWTSSDGIITSTELPTSFPDISVFDLRREFGIGFVEPSTVPNGGGFLIEGDLTYLVPEPATLLLLALGSLAFLRRPRSSK